MIWTSFSRVFNTCIMNFGWEHICTSTLNVNSLWKVPRMSNFKIYPLFLHPFVSAFGTGLPHPLSPSPQFDSDWLCMGWPFCQAELRREFQPCPNASLPWWSISSGKITPFVKSSFCTRSTESDSICKFSCAQIPLGVWMIPALL